MTTNNAKRNIYVGKLSSRGNCILLKYFLCPSILLQLITCHLTLGGLPDEADESVVRAAFIPFGEIVNIEIPPDYENHEKHRGFSFIEYELAEDAAAAIDNMVTYTTFLCVLPPTNLFIIGIFFKE